MYKKVTFTPDTKDPPIPEKCSCCGHRNIIPRIREMDMCMNCFKTICETCLTSMDICTDCKLELFDSDGS